MKIRLLATSSLLVLFIFFILRIALATGPESSVMQLINPPSLITNTVIYTSSLPLVTKAPPPLFFENFSDPNSGWPISDSGAVRNGYQNGEYEITIENSFTWGGAVPPLGDISNYSVDVVGHFQQGSSGAYGLIFDRKDWDHFYLFAILPSSQEFVLFRHDPDWVELVPFITSTYINSGLAINRLRVERKDENISIYINGHFLISVDDSTYKGTFGEVGLFAQTLDETPIAVRFDDFLVMGLAGINSARGRIVTGSSIILIGGGEGTIHQSR